jgi:O-succinylbenzoate synthase
MARLDGQARAEKQNLFMGLSLPTNHWLHPDLASLDARDLAAAARSGFPSVKTKAGRDWAAEARCLQRLAGEWPTDLRLRLDFNASFSFEEFFGAWKRLPDAVRRLVEFVEDPCPWDAEHWARLRDAGAPLAFDRPCAEPASTRAQFDALVLKPAAQDVIPLVAKHPGASLVVTSYLDHPVGQAGAAVMASRIASGADRSRLLACGLLSQTVYERSDFAAAIPVVGGRFMPPEGTGIGFDSLLAALEWLPL